MIYWVWNGRVYRRDGRMTRFLHSVVCESCKFNFSNLPFRPAGWGWRVSVGSFPASLCPDAADRELPRTSDTSVDTEHPRGDHQSQTL